MESENALICFLTCLGADIYVFFPQMTKNHMSVKFIQSLPPIVS